MLVDQWARRVSRRRLVAAAAVGTVALPLLQACGQATGPTVLTPEQRPAGPAAAITYQADFNQKGQLEFWHHWGSPLRRNAIRRVVGTFQQQFPGVKVTETFITFGEGFTKLLAAVAAGSGMPDVMVDDRIVLRDRAKNNIETSIDAYFKRDRLQAQAFWPYTWEEAVYNGLPYGLPYETDVRVFYYNKAVLRDAGLSAETPPKDWSELDAVADKLTVRTAAGLEKIAFHPMVGGAGVADWGWSNGGEWQTKDFVPTINAKANVQTLEWIKQWDDRYGGKAAVDALVATFGPNGPTDRFMSQKVALVHDIQGYAAFLNTFNPAFRTKDNQNLGWGVGNLPAAPGQKPASLSGGFALCLPRGSKQVDAAWEFAKYGALVGQVSWARDTYAMPTLQEVARTDPTLNADPNWRFFVEAMSYGRPGVFNPFYPDLRDVINPAVDDVRAGKKSAQQALDEAQQKAEAEIAKNKR